MREQAHALWYVGPHHAEIRPETLAADVGPGEVRIDALGIHFFSLRTSVFQEYRCFGLWKSLFATYG